MVQVIKNTTNAPALDDEEDTFASDVDIAKRMLAKTPNMQSKQLFEQIMLPLLKKLREDHLDLAAEVDEALGVGEDEIIESTFVDKASALVLNLSMLAEITLVEAGFKTQEGEFTDKVPAQVKAAYEEIAGMLPGFDADVAAFREAFAAEGEELDDPEPAPAPSEAKEPEVKEPEPAPAPEPASPKAKTKNTASAT